MRSGYNTSHSFNNIEGLETEFYELFNSNESNKVLRFPGGTIANKYDIDGNDYGWSNITDHNFIEDFIKMCKATNSDAILVLNLYEELVNENDMFEKNIRLIERIRSEGIEIVGIELGNEFNIYPEITGLWFPFLIRFRGIQNNLKRNTQKYIDIAKRYDDYISKTYGYKCGLVIGNSKNLRDRIWNEEIINSGVGQAYVYHYYQEPKQSLTRAKKEFVQYVKSFDKPLWITEWGIQHGHQSDQNGDVFLSPYMLQFVKEFPEWCSENVEIETMHNLGGKENYYNKYLIEEKVKKRF